MDSWNRKLRMGMVGGGPGSFIGPVHRMVVAMEQQAEMVAGVFSRDPGPQQGNGVGALPGLGPRLRLVPGNGRRRGGVAGR